MKLIFIAVSLSATLLMLLTLACSGTQSSVPMTDRPAATKQIIGTSASANFPTPNSSIVPKTSKGNSEQTSSRANPDATVPPLVIAIPNQGTVQPKESTQVITPDSTSVTRISGILDICDWTTSFEVQGGFIHFSSNTSPKTQHLQNLAVEFTPAIKGFPHPIFNETSGFALHEYSIQELDSSLNEHNVAIPKAETAYRMDLSIGLTGTDSNGQDCEQQVSEASTRSDDYYPSSKLSIPNNAIPNLNRYSEYVGKTPEPDAQSVMLATSSGDWNGVWETHTVKKVDIPLRLGFYGDVGPEDYETVRDLIEILAVIAPDLDIDYSTSLEEVALPLHFVECTEHVNRDVWLCNPNGLSGSLSGRLETGKF